MKLGVYTAVLHDKPLPEALRIIKDLGLSSAEINSGGFVPEPHLPSNLLESETARQDYLGQFEAAGVELTALNCNGNPLDPNPGRGAQARRGHPALDRDRGGTRREARGDDVRDAGHGGRRDQAGLERPAVGQRLPGRPRLPVERRRHPLLEDGPGAGRRISTSRSPSRCTPATWCTTPPPSSGSSTETESHAHRRRDGPEPPLLAGHRPRRGRRPPRVARLQRRRQGHPDQPGGADQRRPRRRRLRPAGSAGPVIELGGGYVLSTWPKASSWDFVAVGRGHDVTGGPVPEGAGADRPRHGGEHRARGRRTRPARGPRVGRRGPARRC